MSELKANRSIYEFQQAAWNNSDVNLHFINIHVFDYHDVMDHLKFGVRYDENEPSEWP